MLFAHQLPRRAHLALDALVVAGLQDDVVGFVLRAGRGGQRVPGAGDGLDGALAGIGRGRAERRAGQVVAEVALLQLLDGRLETPVEFGRTASRMGFFLRMDGGATNRQSELAPSAVPFNP
ncbi:MULTISPECIES: hypothetical protein [unclassified Massilia]|uniref:hypothetical protein n=1 Tax=unclassified Massilia TaxID=2609279 RepID=UPI001E3D3175|nr:MULTISPECIES: hypothetical protein [unclassified Massilia]